MTTSLRPRWNTAAASRARAHNKKAAGNSTGGLRTLAQIQCVVVADGPRRPRCSTSESICARVGAVRDRWASSMAVTSPRNQRSRSGRPLGRGISVIGIDAFPAAATTPMAAIRSRISRDKRPPGSTRTPALGIAPPMTRAENGRFVMSLVRIDGEAATRATKRA